MSELAESIHRNINTVNSSFSDHKVAAPSIETNSPLKFPINDEKVDLARFAVVAAMHELKCLLLGPTETLMAVESEDILALKAIYRYRIDQHLGIDEEATFEEISDRCGLNVIDLRRVLRYSMTNFVFREPRAGFVAHTSLSKALAEDIRLRSYIGMTVDALEQFGHSKEQSQSGFALSQNTKKGLYETIHQDPSRERRWTTAMSAMASQTNFDFILDSFDWPRYFTGTVVDVGGGSGTISEGLALQLPNLNFIVQDSEEVIKQANINSVVQDRISFMAHDFFTEQPAKFAEVYYFRNIFHNWPDEQCIAILKKLIPALKPGAHIIIDDFGLREPLTLPAYQERAQRSVSDHFKAIIIPFGNVQ
ncbi:MAG: hypothetical protein Q9222_001423 [Ikaeria aurantiellina]